MRRHRFGRIAALIALAHLAVVTALGAFTLATGRGGLLWQVVTRSPTLDWFLGTDRDMFIVPWGLALVLVLVGAVQAWALWHLLRGRARGELTHRGRTVGLLRLALYLSLGYGLIITVRVPLEVPWLWTALEIASGLLLLTVVWLFFLVLRGTAARRLRLFSLAAGTLAGVSDLGGNLTDVLAPTHPVAQIFGLAGGYGFVWLAWCVSILIAQARDPRWSAATVRVGVVAQVVAVLRPNGFVSFGDGGFPDILMVYTVLGAISVFQLVWYARTAHELANPLPQPEQRREPARAAARRWPLPAVAVVLPLIPAAVNLAQGRYHWIGPRGAIEQFVREDGGSGNVAAWLALDVSVGVGAPALLVLAAVLRRTRPLLRFTTLALTLAAGVGFVSALTATPMPEDAGGFYAGAQIYPESLFAQSRDGEIFFGVSPSWYGAALLGSALLLLFLYPAAPARRGRHHVLATGLATLLALGFLPVADQSRGPVTTAEDCDPPEAWEGRPAGPELTRDQRFVCSFRQSRLITFAATTPDAVILAHARRLCGVYTRDDPRATARSSARPRQSA
ncbi:MAG: hypothetical protein HOW71_07805 [Nonomuraea sp.]|nr:hypothetical protein [Nonomuraea sp.]